MDDRGQLGPTPLTPVVVIVMLTVGIGVFHEVVTQPTAQSQTVYIGLLPQLIAPALGLLVSLVGGVLVSSAVALDLESRLELPGP